MKTVNATGMKRPVCASCFEYPENCKGCEWHECCICKEELSESEAYEYRGFISCSKHFEELQEKVDYKRKEVQEVVEHSTRSQADGEWANGGYKTMKTDPHTGRPLTKIKEPQILQDYEQGIL